MKQKKVFFLMGPTASGKTNVALELATRFPIEIISVDSAMVYRGLDIGTGKPDRGTLAQFPHHLVDICDPSETYSAKQFCTDATLLCEAIFARGKVPFLVGGTHLYFKALWQGLSDLPSKNEVIRAALDAEIKQYGLLSLYERLLTLDPIAAGNIKPTDTQRIVRALEVIQLEGRPISELWRLQAKPVFPYEVEAFALVPSSRSVLHERIKARYEAMLLSGFVEEVAALYSRGDLEATMPALRSVGYRQIWEYLAGHFDSKTRDERAIFATRQLAKRQLTWLRSWPEVSGILDEKPIILALKNTI